MKNVGWGWTRYENLLDEAKYTCHYPSFWLVTLGYYIFFLCTEHRHHNYDCISSTHRTTSTSRHLEHLEQRRLALCIVRAYTTAITNYNLLFIIEIQQISKSISCCLYIPFQHRMKCRPLRALELFCIYHCLPVPRTTILHKFAVEAIHVLIIVNPMFNKSSSGCARDSMHLSFEHFLAELKIIWYLKLLFSYCNENTRDAITYVKKFVSMARPGLLSIRQLTLLVSVVQTSWHVKRLGVDDLAFGWLIVQTLGVFRPKQNDNHWKCIDVEVESSRVE